MDVHLVLQVWTHPGFWTEIESSIWTNMGVMFLLHPVLTENAEHSPSDSMISWHHAASWISSARMDTCGPAGASQQHTCLNTPTCVRVSIHKNTLNTHTPFEHSALDICIEAMVGEYPWFWLGLHRFGLCADSFTYKCSYLKQKSVFPSIEPAKHEPDTAKPCLAAGMPDAKLLYSARVWLPKAASKLE